MDYKYWFKFQLGYIFIFDKLITRPLNSETRVINKSTYLKIYDKSLTRVPSPWVLCPDFPIQHPDSSHKTFTSTNTHVDTIQAEKCELINATIAPTKVQLIKRFTITNGKV